MSEEKEIKETAEDTSIEKLLRDREKLDEQLKEKFSQDVTVMFTDIKGSTSFFETYGDIEGRLMVQKHNEMLFPLVEKNKGRVIKTIGDAIMASFEDPVAAVHSAIDMQETLFEYNKQKKGKKDRIHIRIGINTGEGLVEQHDIFGDVVNVAARVESLSEPDQIMISAPVYDEVRKTDDIICRYASQTKVKGKEAPIEVFRVVWGDEEAVTGLTRSAAPAAKIARKRKALRNRLEIEIHREGDTLRITAAEKSGKGESTIRPYEEMRISAPKIDERCREITGLLNRANTRGKVSKDTLARLRDLGQVLFDDLLTPKAKEALRSAAVQDLVFHIEDNLVQVPWELLFDGEQFLCQKFNMGRIVKTKHGIVNIKQRQLSRPLKMLIVSDPRGDLENCYKEGQAIREQLDANSSFVSANQRSGQITAAYIMEKIRNFDMLHYAGHADYAPDDPSNSGWLLDGGKFTSADIMKLVGGRPMPSLVFCNACQSGQTEEWKIGASYNQKIFGLANAFLLSGVQHYVGTFWEILDEPSAQFALEFYRAMTEGAAIGEAIRQARLSLIKEYGEDTIVWASYMLYGDPGFNYFDFTDQEEEEAPQETAVSPNTGDAARLRSTPSATVSFEPAAPPTSAKKIFAFGAALTAVALVLIFFFTRQSTRTALEKDPYLLSYSLLQANKLEEARRGFEGLAKDDPRKYEGVAAVFFELGDYDTALEMSEKSLEIAPYNLYSGVIKGNILFSQGKADQAMLEYEKAANRKGGLKWQKAEALNGMARIYSSRDETEKSVEFYGRAAQFNPKSAAIFANYGVAMQKTGDSAGALSSFRKAARMSPNDPYAAVFLAQAEKQQKAQGDKSRQERIDKLVAELAETFQKGPPRRAPADPWTSKPLSISFIDFKQKGAPSMREGEDDFFLLRVNALLQESGRVQVVERELLDKLLAELKLSSTELVDRNTALRLGRILSARVIATGSIMRYKKDVQVAIRLTDTETTAIKGAIFGSGKDLDSIARDTAEKIVAKIKTAYPMRGKVLSLEGNQVVLNIGAEVGVQNAMTFKVLEDIKGEKGLGTRYRPVGTITIASVDRDSSYATISEQSRGFKAEMKVEQLIP